MPAKTTLASRAAALLIAAATLVLAPLAAGAASASQGSVPAVVADYAADPSGLLFRLEDLFGVGSSGKGLDFGDDTKVGELDRVFAWRDDFLAGATGATPVKLTNQWTSAITIGGKPVGVATIWINPASDEPDLADFAEGASLGTAFTGIPAEAALVQDAAHSAWFTLTADTLTPLVTGDSGVTAPVSLASYQERVVADAAKPPAAPAASNLGAVNSVIVVILALVVVAALIVFTGRSRRTVDDADLRTPAVMRTVVSAARTPKPKQADRPAKAPTVPTLNSTPKTPPAPRQPASKGAAAKPGTAKSSAAKPATKPGAKPAAKPGAKPVGKSTAKPAVDPSREKTIGD